MAERGGFGKSLRTGMRRTGVRTRRNEGLERHGGNGYGRRRPEEQQRGSRSDLENNFARCSTIPTISSSFIY